MEIIETTADAFRDNPLNAEQVARGLMGLMLIKNNIITPIEVEDDSFYTRLYKTVEPKEETKDIWGTTHPGWSFVIEEGDDEMGAKIIDGNKIDI